MDKECESSQAVECGNSHAPTEGEVNKAYENEVNHGYTPLQETNVMSMMMMMNNDDNNNDDGDNDNDNMLMFTLGPQPSAQDENEDDDEWGFDDTPDDSKGFESGDTAVGDGDVGGDIGGGGVFYTNLNNFKTASSSCTTENMYARVEDKDTSFDYKAVAEQALLNLDREYDITISTKPAAEICEDPSSTIPKEETATGNTEHEGNARNNNDDNDNDEATKNKSTEHETLFQADFTAMLESTNNKKIQVDKKAISRAMKNIRMQAASNLITKLDTGGCTETSDNKIPSRYPIVHIDSDHPLISSKSLLAFQRGNTRKSIDATSRLTRSATLAHGLLHIFEKFIQSKPKSGCESDTERDVFVIHIIGSDHVECNSKESIEQAIGPFVQWWRKASISKNRGPFLNYLSSFKHLQIELLGPNVPAHASQRKPVLLFPSTSTIELIEIKSQKSNGLQTATAVCKTCLYHEYLEDALESQTNRDPDVVIAYNAGIWGYDDWKPTLIQMNSILPRETPFIITSYTIQEAEDDADVVQSIFCQHEREVESQKMQNSSAFMEPTLNPFGSRSLRETATSPESRQYFENGAWQIWMMGDVSNE